MSTTPHDFTELRLYGEHINLNSRTEDENRKNAIGNKGRPRSALYAPNLSIAEHKRRPFSADNRPSSSSVNSFTRRAQTDRPELHIKTTDTYRGSPTIPGTVDSTTLFNKLLRDPIHNTHRMPKSHRDYSDLASKHAFACDNISDISSVDTCMSLGTKIKNKAQNFESNRHSKKMDTLAGSTIKLKKSKPPLIQDFDKLTDFNSENNLDDVKDEPLANLKLSIYMPNSKDENTSSGVSSSSDVQASSRSQSNSENLSPGPNRLSRSKKTSNISINWFPESSSKKKTETFSKKVADKSNIQDMDETPKQRDLTGIVSFGEGAFARNSTFRDDEEYMPESYKNFTTQLSLVEEESSQDSDLSPKHINEYQYNYDDSKNSPISLTLPIETHHVESNLINSTHTDQKDNLNYGGSCRSSEDYQNKIAKLTQEDEMEQRFKLLESKYKIEKIMREDNIYNSSRIKSAPMVNGGLKHTWTSLENIVSKENDEDITVKNQKEYADELNFDKPKLNTFIFDESLYSDSNTKEKHSNAWSYDEVSSFSDRNVNEEIKERISETITKSLPFPIYSQNKFEKEIDHYKEEKSWNMRDDTTNKLKKLTVPDIVIDYVNDDSKRRSTEDEEKYMIGTEIKQTCVENYKQKSKVAVSSPSFEVDSEKYPQYLEKTDTKVFTSKVIEDYKKEIATINNYHELALKDIRDECQSLGDFRAPSPTKQNRSYSSLRENYGEILEEVKLADLEKDEQKKVEKGFYETTSRNSENYTNEDISSFIDDYNKYKLSEPKIPDENAFNRIAKEFLDKADEKKDADTRMKSKKKIKKKERTYPCKYKNYNSNDSTDSKYTETKKTKHETKRLTKSAPCTKKENRVKFKAQKITLSRSTANINTTMFMDTDKDIVSWMATKTDVPFEETSSADHNDTSTPDIIKEDIIYDTKHVNYYSNPNDLLQIEKKIEPVIKAKPYMMSEESSVTTEIKCSDENLKGKKRNDNNEEVTKSKIKPKEVSFEVDRCTSSVGDEASLTEWVGNQVEENDLYDLLDDDHMVSNIYSVLKEIEQSSSAPLGSGDNLAGKQEDDCDQNVSAEYRDIVNFLERVESAANEEISALSHTQPPFSLKVEELMELSKGELAHRAVAGALAAGKAGAAAARLRTALVSAANRAANRIKSERLAAKQKANIAAQTSAQAISRHQKFIEQLINEKKALAERIEQLVGAVSGSEARSARAARAGAERLQLELRNQRQRLTQAHQRDKQAWLKQHTQKIKEMTIKGLEGEMGEMEKRHSGQMASLQREHETRLISDRERHAKELRVLKESSSRQMEDELDRERLLAAERMEQKRMEWESALAAASERASAEGREAARTARREAEVWKQEQERELDKRRQRLEAQADERRSALMEEVSQLKEKIMKEFEKYKEDHLKKQAEAIKEREAEIRALTRRERDREIEKAIDSMVHEAQEGRKEMQEAINRLKAKYETDMRMLEQSEQTALQRCKEAREQLREAQEQCALNQITMTQMEGKLRQADELRAQTVAEMEISMRTSEIKWREELEDTRVQISKLQLQHKDEMHQLYAKVKVAVSKKDDALTAARRDAATLRDRCLRLEARLVT